MSSYFNVLRNIDDFSGRSNKSEYWQFFLINLVVAMGLIVFDIGIGLFDPNIYLGVTSGIYLIFTVVPLLAATVRRLHDSGKGGAWIFIFLIPIPGAILLLYYMLADSQVGLNQYGAPSRAALA